MLRTVLKCFGYSNCKKYHVNDAVTGERLWADVLSSLSMEVFE